MKKNEKIKFPKLVYYNDIILSDIVGWTVISNFDDYNSQCFGDEFLKAFKDWAHLVKKYFKYILIKKT